MKFNAYKDWKELAMEHGKGAVDSIAQYIADNTEDQKAIGQKGNFAVGYLDAVTDWLHRAMPSLIKEDKMSLNKIISESIAQNPIGLKEALAEELSARISLALEAKLIGKQHELDHNENGKIDSHDFHLMRKKKKMEESSEELDELFGIGGNKINHEKMRVYHAKIASKAPVGSDLMKKHAAAASAPAVAAGSSFLNRSKNSAIAMKKTNDLKNVREDTDQLDELSKSTLGSYVNKAADSYAGASERMARGDLNDPKRKATIRTFIHRKLGMMKAVNKLTKEEYEILESFSRGDVLHVPGLQGTKHPAVHLGNGKAVYLDDEGAVEHVPEHALKDAEKMKKVSSKHKELAGKYLANIKG